MSVLDEVLAANAEYAASFGEKSETECGMEFFDDAKMREILGQSLETAELGADGFRDVGIGPGSAEAHYIDWLAISDRDHGVVEDVSRIRAHPVVPSRIPI
jgi:carbonic anhydrase